MLPSPKFDAFFSMATSHPGEPRTPYDYQRRLAGGDAGRPCESQLISIPTGLGKTAAVVLAWLWNRVVRGDDSWPRRLVYCLPMRTLVEQTRDEVTKWIDHLLRNAESLLLSADAREQLEWLHTHSPVILMGGEDSGEWDIHPERPAILIGTQDMLLSRALNRGYGMGCARWPMHFGLLNNDALWVLDETQLMGPGLWTSAQLDWLRQERFLSLKKCPTWWMSATIGTSFLETLDRTNAKLTSPVTIKTDDNDPAVATLFKAVRRVSIWQQTKESSSAKRGEKASSKTENPRDAFLQSLARAILQEHKQGALSLVVCNSVATAQRLFALVETGATTIKADDPVKLLTSRFRPKDRKANVDVLLSFELARKQARATGSPHPGLICVSTQVVEAGVDVSARRLWSELAPWASLLQRLGRLNRDGRLNQDSQAVVFEVPAEQKGRTKNAEPTGPYDPADIKSAKKIVEALATACTSTPDTPIRELIAQLSTDKTIGALLKQSLEPRPEPFPRAMDVHGLFSTEPDAFGGFTDVSPWVRGSDPNADVIVFWRDWPDAKKNPNQYEGSAFEREEGCPVAVHRLRKFVETHKQAWSWNPKTETWEKIYQNEICPGMTILLPASVGGYEIALGWTGDKNSTLEDLPLPGPFEDHYSDDTLSLARGHWVALDDHLRSVANAMEQISKELSLPAPLTTALQQSAAWHDIGKSIEPWQNALPQPKPKSRPPVFWAKAPYLLRVEVASSPKPQQANLLALIAKEAPSAVLVQIESNDGKTSAYLFQIERRLTLKTLEALREQGVIPLPPLPRIRAFRPGLRHEAASALAAWHRYYRTKSGDFPALVIYLIAAHHGLVRTVLSSREQTGSANVCGIPIQPDHPLPWNPAWKLDFACAQDGGDGEFSEDGLSFICRAPGWTGLVADLLGGWESDAPEVVSGAVPIDEPHSLNPFNLAYLEALLRAADGRASANESGKLPAEANLAHLPPLS